MFYVSTPYSRPSYRQTSNKFSSRTTSSNYSGETWNKITVSTNFVLRFIEFVDLQCLSSVITPPARRAWRSYKFASLDFSVFFFFSVSKVGLPLMGVTAVHSCLSHDF